MNLRLKKKTPRNTHKRKRVHLQMHDRVRVGFTERELRGIVDDIKAEAAGNACGGCRFGLFGDEYGMCARWGGMVFSRGAVACKQHEPK